MKYKLAIWLAVILGLIHILLVKASLPLMDFSGFFVMMIDIPIYAFSDIFFPNLAQTTSNFIILYGVFGTLMYAGIGFLIGWGIEEIRNRKRNST